MVTRLSARFGFAFSSVEGRCKIHSLATCSEKLDSKIRDAEW